MWVYMLGTAGFKAYWQGVQAVRKLPAYHCTVQAKLPMQCDATAKSMSVCMVNCFESASETSL